MEASVPPIIPGLGRGGREALRPGGAVGAGVPPPRAQAPLPSSCAADLRACRAVRAGQAAAR